MFVIAHLIQVHWTLTVFMIYYCTAWIQYIYSCRAMYPVPNIHRLAHFCFDFRLFWRCVWVSSSGCVDRLPTPVTEMFQSECVLTQISALKSVIGGDDRSELLSLRKAIADSPPTHCYSHSQTHLTPLQHHKLLCALISAETFMSRINEAGLLQGYVSSWLRRCVIWKLCFAKHHV